MFLFNKALYSLIELRASIKYSSICWQRRVSFYRIHNYIFTVYFTNSVKNGVVGEYFSLNSASHTLDARSRCQIRSRSLEIVPRMAFIFFSQVKGVKVLFVVPSFNNLTTIFFLTPYKHVFLYSDQKTHLFVKWFNSTFIKWWWKY